MQVLPSTEDPRALGALPAGVLVEVSRGGRTVTLMQEIRKAIAKFRKTQYYDEEQGATFFKDHKGEEAPLGTCTCSAGWMAEELGLDRCLILGYLSKNNPKARAGRDEGGHDFLVVDGKVIVDVWLSEWWRGPLITQMSDWKAVRKWYGEPSKWEKAGIYAE
jgi:hypothetical protein